MNTLRTQKRQRGLVTVEFAMIGLLFFIYLMGIMETARLLFTYNAVAEATRLGARTAAVCSNTDIAYTQTIARFNGASVLPSDFTNGNILVDYLDSNGAPTADYGAIDFARVRVNGYTFQTFLPDFLVPGGTITFPEFTSVRPREALGIVPGFGTGIC